MRASGPSIVSYLFSVGGRRTLTGGLAWVVKPWAAGVALWVVYAAAFAVLDPWKLVVVFLSAMLGLVFLTVGASPSSSTSRPSALDWVLSAGGLASGAYFFINSESLLTRIPLMDPLSASDLGFATALVVISLEAVRRTTGLGLTLLVLIFIAYNFFGHYLGGLLGHGPIGYAHFIDLTVFTTDGMLGLPLRVAATYAFMFVMFGTFLARAGGSAFFFDVAAAVSGRRPGGPAKIAVVSSGLYGMMSGSPTSDVVTTGSVTIPMMRQMGYPSPLAGAFEVAASTGGSLLPPVMGSAAFIMAEYTGIEYRDIAIAAVVPALLYYVSIYAQVNFRSLKMGLRGLSADQLPALGATLRRGGLFFIPLAALTTALLLGYSPNFVAIFGAVSVVAVAAMRRETRLGLRRTYEALAQTTMSMAPVTGACAAAGLVIGGITMTGLAMKFAALVTALTGGDLFLSLMVAAALTIVLGMGMPTPSAYILAAVLVGPLLTSDLGVPIMAAHMFLLYFAVMSAITPPVAVAAYAAAPLAEANPLHIAVLAVRLALAAFIVPFAFVYSPALLLSGSPLEIALAMTSAVVGIYVIAVGVEGFFRAPLAWWARIAAVAAGLGLVAPSVPTATAAVAILAAVFGAPIAMRRLGRSSAP